MFEKGEMVYYGTAGVCKVGDICKSPFDKNDARMYYMLEPSDFSGGTIIYAPAEGGKVMLRALMTAEEARALIDSMAELEPIEVTREKHRREEYRNALHEGTPLSIARIIKTVYDRRKKAIKSQKRLADTDTEFDKTARRALMGEISCVLGIDAEEAERLVNISLKN